MLKKLFLLILICTFLSSCTNLTPIKVVSATSITYDYSTTIKMINTNKYVEGNTFVLHVWPVVISTAILYLLAEWQESIGNSKIAFYIYLINSSIHIGAGTYNLTRK